MKEKLQKRLEELEKEFNELTQKKAEFDKQSGVIQVRLVQLQGSYEEVKKLMEPEGKKIKAV